MKPISVLLADDHNMVRDGLRSVLEADGGIQVVAEASNGRIAVDLARKLRPDVVVMDIGMPVLNGLEATRQIRKAVPEAKVLILSAHNDWTYVDQVMALGAVGYALKQSSAHVLCQAVREVQNGFIYLSPSIARDRSNFGNPAAPRLDGIHRPVAKLSSREIEVIQLIAEGRANKQVAGDLGISVKTVEKHRQSLMKKLDIHDTAGLTRYAIASGIIESSVQLSTH